MKDLKECTPLFFVDGRVVQKVSGIRTEVCRPIKAGPVILREKPWEMFYMHPLSVVGYSGKYYLYYLVYVPGQGSFHCLAISDDGLKWEKPELEQVEFMGSKSNNMIKIGGAVSVDKNAPSEHRFICLGADHSKKQGEKGFVLDGLAVWTSPDGMSWKQASSLLAPFTCDSTNQVFYDDKKRKYVFYVRAFPGRRAVAYYESSELFSAWDVKPSADNEGEVCATLLGQERTVYIVDELPICIDKDKDQQVYNPCVVSNGGVYFAFPDIFRIFPGPGHPDRERYPDSELYQWNNDGLVAPGLYISEDGMSFREIGDKPYIDLGYGNDFDIKQVRMASGYIDAGDCIWQYYGGHQTGHTLARGKRPRKECAVMRSVQRKDGFAAVSSGLKGGEIITRSLMCEGNDLYLNYDAGAWGEVRVEITDDQGRVIPGFGINDSAPLVGNAVYEKVQWSGCRSLHELQGKQISLKYYLKGASLFSFLFE